MPPPPPVKWTTAELLADIRGKAMIADGHPAFSTTVLLRMADEETRGIVLPVVRRHREEFGTHVADFAVTAAQQGYRVPRRALFGLLRDVSLLDASGNLVRKLSLLFPEQVDEYSNVTTSTDGIFGYCLLGELIHLLPTPSETRGTLRVRFYRRPSNLVVTGEAAQITVISADRLTLTVASHPWEAGSKVDLIQDEPGHDILDSDRVISSKTATTISFLAPVDSEVAVNNWIAWAEQTPIPQIPTDLHTVLAQAVAAKVLEQTGSEERYARAKGALAEMLTGVADVMSPRNQGAATKIINRRSPLRSMYRG